MKKVTIVDSWDLLEWKGNRTIHRSHVKSIRLSASETNYIVEHETDGIIAIPKNKCEFYKEI